MKRLGVLICVVGVLGASGTAWAPVKGRVLHFKATEQAQTWHSDKLYGESDLVDFHVYRNGRPVPAVLTKSDCAESFETHYVVVHLNGCGVGAVPIRLRYVSLRHSHRFVAAYQVR